MSDDPSTPPREPSDSPSSQPSESPPAPPFEPDPEMIGYLEREQRGAERR